MELSDKINCDPESGATSFILCDRIAAREYPDDLTETYTLVPGFLVGLVSPHARLIPALTAAP
jgi:hypothetical protein